MGCLSQKHVSCLVPTRPRSRGPHGRPSASSLVPEVSGGPSFPRLRAAPLPGRCRDTMPVWDRRGAGAQVSCMHSSWIRTAQPAPARTSAHRLPAEMAQAWPHCPASSGYWSQSQGVAVGKTLSAVTGAVNTEMRTEIAAGGCRHLGLPRNRERLVPLLPLDFLRPQAGGWREGRGPCGQGSGPPARPT